MVTRGVFAACLRPLPAIPWVVYAKRPFGGPEQVLDHLARYTHRVAIATSRLVTLADGRVSFLWKDYRHHDKPKVMTLGAHPERDVHRLVADPRQHDREMGSDATDDDGRAAP